MELPDARIETLGDIASLALFLDIDGTLVPIAAIPAAVRPSPELPALLARVAGRLGGALGVVSGREIASIDQVTHSAVPFAAGSHGAEFRLGPGQPILRPGPHPDVAGLEAAVLERVEGRAGILIEPKRAGLAVHYRLAPALGPWVRDMVRDLLAARVQADLAMLQGDHVVEIRSPAHHKGEAVRRIMKEPPFRCRRPVFIGDDVTDEDAFIVVQELGGTAIIVGERRPTLATYKLDSVAAVLDLLHLVGEGR
jgi:trehalose 6-phosphate phosphatase